MYESALGALAVSGTPAIEQPSMVSFTLAAVRGVMLGSINKWHCAGCEACVRERAWCAGGQRHARHQAVRSYIPHAGCSAAGGCTDQE